MTEHPTVHSDMIQFTRCHLDNRCGLIVYSSGNTVAGWSSLVAREAHNLEVVGSNPAPANFFDGSSRQKNRAVDGRKLRVENSKLSPIHCGLLSTFYSLSRPNPDQPMAFAFEKLLV
jgi:hypothetical protein